MPEFSNTTDEVLIRQIIQGNEKAFQMIYERYCRQLIGFAVSYLPHTSDAEEIVQSVFVELWEKRLQLEPERFAKNFLYRMTVNKVYNHLKHRIVERKYAQYVEALEMNTVNEAERKIYQEELQAVFKEVLEQLPEQQKKIFYLSRWEGLSNKEIAQQLNISVRTVENQLYRAVKFIRANLRADQLSLFLLIELLVGNYF